MTDIERVAEVSRRLRSRADAVLGVVWSMPEAREGYPGVAVPAWAAGLASRAACMGRVAPEVVAAVFAPMRPEVVVAALREAWAATDPETLVAARLDAATRMLASVVGEAPDGAERAVALLRPAVEALPLAGCPVYAGLRSLPWPGTTLGDLWRACDMVREHRGDAHVNAWRAAGLDPVEVNLLSELWRGMRPGSVAAGMMGWSTADVAAARERLRARGLVDGDDGPTALTAEGRRLRDDIEAATDGQAAPLVEALGDDAGELLGLMEPWARACAATLRQFWGPTREAR